MKGKDKKGPAPPPAKPAPGKSTDKAPAGKDSKDKNDKNAKNVKGGSTGKSAVDPKEVEKSKFYFSLSCVF